MFCTYIQVMCTLARAYVFVGAHVHLCIYLFMMGLWFWLSSISGCLIYCLVLFQGQDCFICKKMWPPSKRLSWKVQGWLFKFENLFKMWRFRTWYVFMLEWLFTWWSQGFFPLPFFHTQRKKNQSFCHFFLPFGEEWKTKTSHVGEDKETS